MMEPKGGQTMNTKKYKVFYTKLVAGIAYKVAKMDANTTCSFHGFQPEVPDSVKKLSKIEK